MKRFHVWLTLSTIIGASVLYIYLNGASILAFELGKQFKVPVAIASMTIGPQSIVLDQFIVSNPPPIRVPPFAIRILRSKFKAPFWRYFQKHILIHQILLQDLHLSVVFTDPDNKQGNWTTLQNNLNAPPNAKAPDDGTIEVEEIRIQGLYVELQLYGKDPIKLDRINRDIVIKNVSSKRGIPTEEISSIVIEQLMNQLGLLYGIENMLESVVEAPVDIIEGLILP